MKIGRKRILLVAFALVSVVGLGGFYLRPHPGMCVKRDMMFWRTNVRATPVRDNVFMLSVYGTDLISGNTAALVGDEGVLLVDPGHPEMLSKLHNALPYLRDPRVRMVINSHMHQDHSCSNGELFAEGAIIVGHSSLRKHYESPEWDRERQPGDAPQVSYDSEMTLPFNGEQVRLLHPPRAHTDGDTITLFERANVIHTGDIFVTRAFPYMGGSSIDGYIAAHELILKHSNDKTLVIPGHGPLARRADVEKSLWRMREVRRRIAALIDQGLNEEEVLARHPLDDLDPYIGDPSGRREVTSPQAVARHVYASLTEEPRGETDRRPTITT